MSDNVSDYVGTYDYVVDSKGRLTIPTKYKNLLGETFFLRVHSYGEFRCICLYNREKFNKEYRDFLTRATTIDERDDLIFEFQAGSNEISLDSKGRINIPANALRRAKITDECMMTGVGTHVEIWNRDEFDECSEGKAKKRVRRSESSQSENTCVSEYVVKSEKSIPMPSFDKDEKASKTETTDKKSKANKVKMSKSGQVIIIKRLKK